MTQTPKSANNALPQALFILTLNVALIGAWFFSGERFLDWVFEMPDLGRVDDVIIEAAVQAEEWKARIGPSDYFGQTRALIHQALGLN